MLLRSVVEWICFVFASISFPIYVFYITILIVYRNTRELKGTFFQLCISIGIGDIISIINNYVGYRFPSWGWGTAWYISGGPPLAKPFICLAWYLRVYQGIGVVMLAINRACAIIWPHKYLKLWTSQALRAVVCLQILYGFAFVVPLLFQGFYWQVDNSTEAAVARFDDNVFKAKYFFAAFLSQTVAALLITICYVAMFADLRRQNIKVTVQASQMAKHVHKDALSANKHKQEMNLALMGAIICSFEIIWFVFFLYTSVISPLSTDTFFLIYNPLTDLYSCINPYLMYAFSSAVRERIKITLHLKADKSIISVRSSPRPSNVSQITKVNRPSITIVH